MTFAQLMTASSAGRNPTSKCSCNSIGNDCGEKGNIWGLVTVEQGARKQKQSLKSPSLNRLRSKYFEKKHWGQTSVTTRVSDRRRAKIKTPKSGMKDAEELGIWRFPSFPLEKNPAPLHF